MLSGCNSLRTWTKPAPIECEAESVATAEPMTFSDARDLPTTEVEDAENRGANRINALRWKLARNCIKAGVKAGYINLRD